VTKALADLPLVAVHLRSVDVPVAYRDGLSNRLCGLLWLDLEDPETELRDGVAIVESDVRNRAQSRTSPSYLVTTSLTREPHDVTPIQGPPNRGHTLEKASPF
jgi:hypothetical protein